MLVCSHAGAATEGRPYSCRCMPLIPLKQGLSTWSYSPYQLGTGTWSWTWARSRHWFTWRRCWDRTWTLTRCGTRHGLRTRHRLRTRHWRRAYSRARAGRRSLFWHRAFSRSCRRIRNFSTRSRGRRRLSLWISSTTRNASPWRKRTLHRSPRHWRQY